MKTYHIRLLAVTMDNGERANIDSYMQSETPIGAVDMGGGTIFTYSHSINEDGKPVFMYREAVTINGDEFCNGRRR